MCPSSPVIVSAELNNRACIYIHQGDYENAITILKEGLQIAKQSTKEAQEEQSHHCCSSSAATTTPTTQSPQDCHDESAAVASFEMTPGEVLKTTAQAASTAAAKFRCGDPSKPFVCDDPIPITSFPITMEGDDIVAYLSFTLLFNLALSYHLRALQDDSMCREVSSRLFETAQRLYEYTFQLQSQLTEVSVLTTVALLNNLAQVHKSLKNEFEAYQCEKLLLSALLLIVDMGEPAWKDRVDSYMCNVMHLIFTESGVAASAA